MSANYLKWRLYQIDQRISECVDDETGEWLDIEKIEALQIDEAEVIEQLACEYKNSIAYAEALKKEKKSLETQQKRAEKQAEDLKDYISKRLDGQKFKTTKVSITFRKTPDAVNIVDESSIPDEYMRIKKEPDKTLIKEDMKLGVIVPGAELVSGRSMTIK